MSNDKERKINNMPKRMSREDQISTMSEIHNHFYSYDKWGHPKGSEKSTVTCPQHGDWEVSYANHYHHASGCPYCAVERRLVRFAKRPPIEEWHPRLLEIIYFETAHLLENGPEDLIFDPSVFMANVIEGTVQEYEITGYVKNAADNDVPNAQEFYEYLVEAGFEVDR